jgi:hypothetical protein
MFDLKKHVVKLIELALEQGENASSSENHADLKQR